MVARRSCVAAKLLDLDAWPDLGIGARNHGETAFLSRTQMFYQAEFKNSSTHDNHQHSSETIWDVGACWAPLFFLSQAILAQ
jgi:hypothetical protein